MGHGMAKFIERSAAKPETKPKPKAMQRRRTTRKLDNNDNNDSDSDSDSDKQGVETYNDFDEYCHYVAGLVGIGLSKLFFVSGLETQLKDKCDNDNKNDINIEKLSNSMGLFLQKTNIIRDYLEDITELPKPRMFWPKVVLV